MTSKDQPFLASIKVRENLTAPHSDKLTQHIVLDIAGSNLTYEVGDCLGVYPHHDAKLVQETIAAMGANSEVPIEDKRRGDTVPLFEFLSRRRNITSANKKVVTYILENQPNEDKKQFLETTLGDRDKAKLYVARDLKTILE